PCRSQQQGQEEAVEEEMTPLAGERGHLFFYGLSETFTREQGDTLNVIRLWEHIERLCVNQAIAVGRAKRGNVASQGAGIARDIGDGARRERLQGLDRLWMAPCAGWIDHNQVNPLAAVVELA